MKKEVIAIFDMGKTNKKILLFDEDLKVVYEESKVFEETLDDEGFPADDIVAIETWMDTTLESIIKQPEYDLKAVNFSTHGATVFYLNAEGRRLTPMYNYLKELPENISNEVFESNGGKKEFCRRTASPAMGFLNSALQIKWLKQEKPLIYKQVQNVLHYQQYLSFRYTGKITSEYTSVGSHTMLWDFDNNTYHPWVKEFDFELPIPIKGNSVYKGKFKDKEILFGIGMHDSSAALTPYLLAENEPFILLSTGTWGIVMNPFNTEKLTYEELKDNSLCFMSYKQDQVKSALFLLGMLHEANAKELSKFFALADDAFKQIELDKTLIREMQLANQGKRLYFKTGIPKNNVDKMVDIKQFKSYKEAYHRLMLDLTDITIQNIENVITAKDSTKKIFVSGGFANNAIFLHLLKEHFPSKKIFISEIDNASALGAAAVIRDKIFPNHKQAINLGLKEIKE